MKKKNYFRFGLLFMGVILLSSIIMTFTTCKKDKDEVDCHALITDNPGYEVWAGDVPYFHIANNPDYFYNIDKYGYTLIGSSTTTQTFNTGSHKYYVIVAKYWSCVDAIMFKDSTYYGNLGGQYTGGFTEATKITGAPDGVYGKFGDRNNCIGSNSNNGFITDDTTITCRGGGLTVIVGSGCQ